MTAEVEMAIQPRKLQGLPGGQDDTDSILISGVIPAMESARKFLATPLFRRRLEQYANRECSLPVLREPDADCSGNLRAMPGVLVAG